MTEMIILASLAARTTFMEVVPSDESRTLAFAAGLEAGGVCLGEPAKGVVLLKKGASSQGPLEDDDEGIWKNNEVIRQYTIELLSNYPQEIQEMAKNADINSLSFTHLRYRTPWDLLVGNFSRGTVTVAGDAMHIMGPFLGQGGSAALEDAVVLARNMATTGLNDRVGAAFNEFVRQRRIRVVRLSLQAYLIGMLLGSSRLEKIIWIILLKLLFPNQESHMDYDCGGL
ncbi:monooxygenase 1-like [Bidens hawaiensis]|uniref:monooxygenase 1-like n=1 Tax=Bidens hawaiensis TaxID=980011 RepID=UPI004049FF80